VPEGGAWPIIDPERVELEAETGEPVLARDL
jgi:hypothetical protein